MLERDVIRKTLAGVKDLGIAHIRMTFMQGAASGWPDYFFLLPGGKTLWIEFKRPGGKPTALQAYRMAALHALGFRCYVIDDPVRGVQLLRDAYFSAEASENRSDLRHGARK